MIISPSDPPDPRSAPPIQITQEDLNEVIAFLGGPTPLMVPLTKETLFIIKEGMKVLRDTGLVPSGSPRTSYLTGP